LQGVRRLFAACGRLMLFVVTIPERSPPSLVR
jgi:hypothetical protein